MQRLLIFASVVAIALAASIHTEHERVRRQLSGSRTNFPGGGFSQSATLSKGPAWGSVSQNFDHRGRGGPQTFSGGLGFQNNNGHGVGFGGSKTPSRGGSIFAEGRAPLINNGPHRLDATASHTNMFNNRGQRVGEVNTGGLDYRHQSGFGANAGISHVPGRKDEKTFGLTYQKDF